MPQNIKVLALIDVATGMAFQERVRQAQATALEAEQAYLLYIENLHFRYHAAEGEWAINNWAVGFVRREDAENNT